MVYGKVLHISELRLGDAVKDATGSSRLGWSGRMTARECLIFLTGLIYAIEVGRVKAEEKRLRG